MNLDRIDDLSRCSAGIRGAGTAALVHFPIPGQSLVLVVGGTPATVILTP